MFSPAYFSLHAREWSSGYGESAADITATGGALDAGEWRIYYSDNMGNYIGGRIGNFAPYAVPEPATLGLLGGLLALGAAVRRVRR